MCACVCVCAVATRLLQFAGFFRHIKGGSLAMNFAAIICANSQRASRITAAIRGCWVVALIHLLSLTTSVFWGSVTGTFSRSVAT